MSKNRRQNVERTKVMALIAALLLGGALVYMACTNSEEVTVEYNGVTYTAQEYNRLMAEQYRLQIEEEARQNLSGGKNPKFLTLIDDDGYNSFTEKLLPVMKEKNVSISMAIETGKAGTGDFMSWETIAENHAAGAEVLNHSRWHIYSAEESEKRDRQAVKEEMIGSIQDLIDHGYADTADIYIYPGASAGSTWFIAQEVFRVGINSSGSVVNQPPFQQYNMRRYPIGSTHVPDFEEMKGYIDEIPETGGWEIWMMHSHNGYMTDAYIEALKQAVDYCRQTGVQIVSAKYVLDYYDVQKK